MLKIDWEALRCEWETAPHGEKRAFLEGKATVLDCSVDTLYRGLRRRNGKRKSVEREKQIPQFLIDEVAKMKRRGAGGSLVERELSTAHCIRRLQERGIEGAEQLTVSSVNRRLAEAGFRDPEIKVRIEAAYANQEHQLDFSRSKYFQMDSYDSGRDDYILKSTGKALFYKQGDARFRTWLVQLIDSYSRVRICQAYGATGETGLLGLTFLNYVYTRPEDSNPLRYLPDMLKTDNGAFEKKREVRAAMDALKIEPRRSKPYNKDSQGKIERSWRVLWHDFELVLYESLAAAGVGTMYLSEYNDALAEYMSNQQYLAHPVRNGERGDLYRQSILRHPPRQIDFDILSVACKVEYRLVTRELMVRYNNVPYETPAYCVGKRIRVYRNMEGELMGETVEEDRKPFMLKPYPFREIDNFNDRHPAGYRQQIQNVINAEAKEVRPPLPAKNRKEIFLPARPRTQKPDSVFADPEAIGDRFPTEFAARAYIGKRVPSKNYLDYAEIFDDLIAGNQATKAEINQVLDLILGNGPVMALKQTGE